MAFLPDEEEQVLAPASSSFVPDEGSMALASIRDKALKVGEGFNAVNAGTWAALRSLTSDEKISDAYRRYQNEGNPVALAAKKALEDAGVENKWVIGAAGLIGDIVGDPLTYTGFGVLTKAGKTAAKTGKLASTLGKQAKAGQRALVTFAGKPVIKGVKAMDYLTDIGVRARPALRPFKTGSQIVDPDARQAFDKTLFRAGKRSGFISDALERNVADMNDFALRSNLSDADLREVINIVESPDLFSKVDTFGDKGIMAKKLSEFLELNRGVREGAGDVLGKLGADNLAGTYERTVPELGGKFRKRLENLNKRIDEKDAEFALRQRKKQKDLAKLELAEIYGKVKHGSFVPDVDKVQDDLFNEFVDKVKARDADSAMKTAIKEESNLANMAAQFEGKDIGRGQINKISKYLDYDLGVGQERMLTKPELDDLSSILDETKKYGAVKVLSDTDLDKLSNYLDYRLGESAYDQRLWTPKEIDEINRLVGASERLPNYVPHAFPEEVEGAFRQQARAGSVMKEATPDEVARTLIDNEGVSYTIDELNKFSRMTEDQMLSAGVPKPVVGKISEINRIKDQYYNSPNLAGFIRKRPDVADDLFSTNPGFIAKTAKERTVRAVKGAMMRDEIASGFGRTLDEIEANPQKYSNWRKVDKWGNTKSKDLYFAPEVADEISRVEDILSSPQSISEFLRVFDNSQNFLKAWTLSPFPGYHSRNYVGAVFNNFLAGVKDPRAYMKAGKVQRILKRYGGDIVKAKDDLAKLTFGGQNGYDVIRGARQNGIKGSTIFEGELITGRKPTKNIFSAEGPWIRKGKDVGESIEDNVRLAHFIDKVEDGFNFEEAAKSVMKYQFDYGDISPFEKAFFARALPFYRFLRFNVPMQIMEAVKQPGKFAAMEKARAQINMTQGLDKNQEALLDEYVAANSPLKVGTRKDGTDRMFALGAWIPSLSALSDVSQPVEKLVSMITPFIKVPIEQAINYDTFRKSKIKDPSRGRITKPIFGVNVPNRLKHIQQNIRILNEADKIFGAIWNEVDPEGSPYITRHGHKGGLEEEAIRQLTGITTSSFDRKESLKYKKFNKLKELREAMNGFKSARRRGDKKNMEEMFKIVLEKRKELGELAGVEQLSPIVEE